MSDGNATPEPIDGGDDGGDMTKVAYFSVPGESYGLHRAGSDASLQSLDETTAPLDRMTIVDLLDPFAAGPVQFTKRLNSRVKAKGSEIRSMAKRQKDRVLKGHEEDIDRLKRSVVRNVERLEQRLSSTNAISLTEKLTFSLGVMNIFLIGYLIGSHPHLFHVLYSLELAFLLPLRIYTYRRKEWHYYLVDLCYFVNALVLLYLWVFPNSVKLYISCYAFSFGTLSWAVITWRNSLVLHSIDKTTSTFIHVLPPVVFHVITHRLDYNFKAERFPGAVKLQSWNWVQGVTWTSVAYFTWQFSYHYFITLKRKEKIKAGRVTSFEHLRKSYAKTMLGRFVNSLPEPFPVVAFTLIQFGYQLSTMALCPLWHSNEVLSTIFMSYIFYRACYNGATYYLDIFGNRFHKELLKLQAEVAEWQANQLTPPLTGVTSAVAPPDMKLPPPGPTDPTSVPVS
uniref:Glycerophosphocholine acyltransferase 1 n=1 Tax=Blastobotrys adeninivorans TaxID=409370 RepID=A0A060T8V7_BLAAD